ncbi:MAG: hypothetical protein ACOX7F_08850 [Eubacteriales bacterium]|jgi:niacin transporter
MHRALNKTHQLVICGILVALGTLIPMVMPVRIPFGPYTATLASHVPILLAAFLSMPITIGTAIGTTLGFILGGFAPVVVWRAASHIFFALFMALLFQKLGTRSFGKVLLIALAGSVIHAIAEVAVIAVDFSIAGVGQQVVNGQSYTIQLFLAVTFLGTIAHHCMDFAIAWVVQQALTRAHMMPSFAGTQKL